MKSFLSSKKRAKELFMKKLKAVNLLFSLVVVFNGCQNEKRDHPVTDETLGIPNAEERLSENPQADILMINQVTYINVEDLGYDNDKEYELGELVLTVQEQSTDGDEFEHGTASKLPVGTKVYKSKNHDFSLHCHSERREKNIYNPKRKIEMQSR